MSIPFYEYKESTREFPNNPFPPEISENPMVLYHGTSSMNELSIEEKGLEINTSVFSLEEVREVLKMFNYVKWPNKRFWSESNLRNFTLRHDYANPELKPIYLGEYSHRTCLYASWDFAGGEIARAIRNTFKELNALINDPAELEKELESIERNFPFTYKNADDYDLGLNKIINELNSKKDLFARAERLKKDYDYGIIYAVSFDESDIEYLKYSLRGGMGIKCFRKINNQQLIGKTILHKDYVHNPISVDPFNLPSWNGILSRVKKDN